MYADAGTTDIPTPLRHNFGSETMQVMGFQVVGGLQTLLWIAFFASFAAETAQVAGAHVVADAHVQAPIVLAAILLKMGGYGIPMFPVASDLLAPFALWLSGHRHRLHFARGAGAVGHEEADRLFLGRAHGGYVTMGIFAANQQGIDGAIFQMISHGFSSGALLAARRGTPTTGCTPARSWLRRPRRADAGLCADLHALHHGRCWACRAPPGFVGEFLMIRRRVPGEHRTGTARILSAAYVSGSIAAWRSAIRSRNPCARSRTCRGARDLRAAGGDDAAARRLPEPCDGHHRAVRGRPRWAVRNRIAGGGRHDLARNRPEGD